MGHKENQGWGEYCHWREEPPRGLCAGTQGTDLQEEICLHQSRCSGNNLFAYATLGAFPPSQAGAGPALFSIPTVTSPFPENRAKHPENRIKHRSS